LHVKSGGADGGVTEYLDANFEKWLPGRISVVVTIAPSGGWMRTIRQDPNKKKTREWKWDATASRSKSQRILSVHAFENEHFRVV
jgi:hypothetical protein